MKETDLLNRKIIQYARHFAMARRVNSIGMRGRTSNNTGMADIYILYKGKSIWIETKKLKEKQLDSQREFEVETILNGGLYMIIHDFESFKEFFDEYKSTHKGNY